MNKGKLAVIGLGSVGLPLMCVLSKRFDDVIGLDIDKKRLSQIHRREEIIEPNVVEYLENYCVDILKTYGSDLRITPNYDYIADRNIVFVVANTPANEKGYFDVSAVRSIVESIHSVNIHCIIVVCSTVNPDDIDQLIKIHERIVYNPEMIAQGKIIKDFENPKYVLLGGHDSSCLFVVADLWRKIIPKEGNEVIFGTPNEIELSKILLNVKFCADIVYANIVGQISEHYAVDPDFITNVLSKDVRNYKAGLGYAGLCFPRDVRSIKAMSESIRSLDNVNRFAFLLTSVNDGFWFEYVRKIKQLITMNEMYNIGIIGLTYKSGVPYIAESQAYSIMNSLSGSPYLTLFVYDELFDIIKDMGKLNDNVTRCDSIEEVVDKSDIILLGQPIEGIDFKDKIVIDPWRVT